MSCKYFKHLKFCRALGLLELPAGPAHPGRAHAREDPAGEKAKLPSTSRRSPGLTKQLKLRDKSSLEDTGPRIFPNTTNPPKEES